MARRRITSVIPSSSSSETDEDFELDLNEKVEEPQSDEDSHSEDEDYEPEGAEDDLIEELESEDAAEDNALYQPDRYNIRLETPEQREAWVRLARLNIHPTRYPCRDTMIALGIYEDVLGLLNRIGWNRALNGNWPTYPALVYEFLSTLDVERSLKRGPHTMTFQLAGAHRTLTAADVNRIFHIPGGGIYTGFDFSMVDFWLQIQQTTTGFEYKRAKASTMPNPVFRYIQKITSSTILAHHETSGMRKNDLLFLWAMLSGTNVNFGAFLMQQFLRQARQATDAICIGGMITPIAQHFGIRVDEYERLPETLYIDLPHLRNTRMLAGRTDRHLLNLRGDQCFPLPNRQLTTVSDLDDRTNWLMDTPVHLEAIVGVDNEGRMGEALMANRDRPRERVESSAQGARKGLNRSREGRDEEQLDSLIAMMASMNSAIGTLNTNYTALNDAFQLMRTDVSAMQGQVQDIQNLVQGWQQPLAAYYPGHFYGVGPSGQEQPQQSTLFGSRHQRPQPPTQQQMPPYMWPPPYPYPHPFPRPPPSS